MMVLASRPRRLQARAGKLSRRGPTPPEILSWLKIAQRHPEAVSVRHGKPAVDHRRHILLGRSSLLASLSPAQRLRILCEATLSELEGEAEFARVPIDEQKARRGHRKVAAPVGNTFAPLPSHVPVMLILCPLEVPIRRFRRDLFYEL